MEITNNQQRILIVEDEVKLALVLEEFLQQAGYASHCLHDGDQVIPWLNEHRADLVILDLMLPGTDGITLCRQIREQSDIPIIMATAKVDEVDRLKGLEIGADDYLCKPFSLKEMVARVKVILRRTGTQSEAVADKTTSIFKIDQAKMTIHIHQKPLDLTPVEFRLLNHLLSQQEVVFSRNDLLDVIYDDYRLVCDRTIDSHIKNLRKKIQTSLPDQEVIHSVYGVGYKLDLLKGD
ncbi:response regulator [Motiliproteus sp. MSK22-1]|uniref:response regulator n=1 Tax=Motiliproteus sp. MSK22-1 TaxID=1897630 RepID=UPI0009785586|nr:response regulator [Motiliproteus sp. MSK22-1]OMH25779.1 two-component system response regulator BaeR [Motiliproteus sp. MSK22-1]